MGIPKIIHLCWFGKGKYPQLAEMCIDSWKNLLPDYEIMIWNEDTFDVNECPFTSEAYKEKKWAFVSDYVRLKALWLYGGVYMDTDLEVIRDFSKMIENKRFVASYIEGGLISAGFLASEPNHPYVKKMLDYYDNQSEKIKNGIGIQLMMNPLIFTNIAIEMYGFDIKAKTFSNSEIMIYPYCYFMPYKKNILSKNPHAKSNYSINKNTYTIHHDMSSWKIRNKTKKMIAGSARLILPEKIYYLLKVRKNQKTLSKMTTES